MKPRILLIGMALVAAPLSGCASGGNGYGYGRHYNGWYDGYYGSIHDGYWGRDGYYYYRLRSGERNYHRGDRGHFTHGDNDRHDVDGHHSGWDKGNSNQGHRDRD